MMRRIFLGAFGLFLGALILSPAIIPFGFDPVPGDIDFRWGNTPIFIPLTYSLCVGVGLTLFWKFMKR